MAEVKGVEGRHRVVGVRGGVSGGDGADEGGTLVADLGL